MRKPIPRPGFLPDDLEGEIRALELIDYVTGSLHVRGATLAMLPGKFTSNEDGQREIAAHGRDAAISGLVALADRLGTRDYFFDRFTIADAAVFFLLQWKERADLTVPAALVDFDRIIKAGPAVGRALSDT